jgi:hypothetical protein
MRGATTGILALALAASLHAQAVPDFTKQVQPILQRKCMMCHNAKLPQAGVRLDDGEAALKGGNSGPVIVPGKADQSKVYQRVISDRPGHRMPPVGPPLSPAEVATLKSWIESGANWPKDAAAPAEIPRVAIWSFQPLKRPPVPEVKKQGWVRNPIDNFVLARLEKEGVQPSPEAAKATLLRRVYLDVTGLPPSPRELDDFLHDNRPDAYELAVERLLRSPHYGERMARFWLDLARYADSDGFEKDLQRPWAWRYRDYVIQAFNEDKPFDQFTIEQLAGHLLPGATASQLIATGWHRTALVNREGGIDPRENRYEQLVSRVSAASTTWMGLTTGCAQCHDHKYDPIRAKDFYQLYAFFNHVKERDIDAPLPGELGPWLQKRAEYLKEREHLLWVYNIDEWMRDYEQNMVQALENPGQGDLEWDFQIANSRPMFDYYEEVIRTPREKRDPRDQERLLYWFLGNPGPARGAGIHKTDEVRECRERLARLDARYPKVAKAMIMEQWEQLPETRIALKGDYRSLGEAVEPDVPASLPPLPKDAPRNLLGFAQWLVSDENPLTARVMANRYWQEIFGRGLVRTSEDFGTQGEKPTHPELLDWLAAEFRDGGWSTKNLIRLIVTSTTYRQSSHARPELKDRDPENLLLARQNRVRLPAELIRDAALNASGLLNSAVGGPSVKPFQPAGVAELGYANSVKWEESEGPAKYRRGLYVHFQRTTPYPMLMNFDAPDSNVACSRRRRSNSPLQALNLLNDPVFSEAAQTLAHRLLTEYRETDRLENGFLLTVGRLPSEAEKDRLRRFLDQQASVLAENPEAAREIFPLNPEAAHWVSLARVLLNTDEFITRE